MATGEDRVQQERTGGPERTGRLPYEPPAIEETSEFETLALSCGHTQTSGAPECDPGYGGHPGS
jgi:hypothetical protein